MHRISASIKIGSFLSVLLIAGCTSTTAPTPQPELTTPVESATPGDTIEVVPTEVSTQIQTEESADSQCIACHQDKDQLIQTADPVEEIETESSGEG
jgi:hypothetical protein